MVLPPIVQSNNVIDGPLPTCLGYEQLTFASTATATLTVPAQATRAILQAETQNVRYRSDGTDPTTTVGMLITAGREVLYPASNSHLAALKFVRAAAGAILNVQYY